MAFSASRRVSRKRAVVAMMSNELEARDLPYFVRAVLGRRRNKPIPRRATTTAAMTSNDSHIATRRRSSWARKASYAARDLSPLPERASEAAICPSAERRRSVRKADVRGFPLRSSSPSRAPAWKSFSRRAKKASGDTTSRPPEVRSSSS